MRVSSLLIFSLLIIPSLFAQNNFVAKVNSKSAFMFTELNGGQNIDLPIGKKVQLLEILDNRIMIKYKNVIGYTYPDFLVRDQVDVFKNYKVKMAELELIEKSAKVKKEGLKLTEEFDSIKYLYKDSSMLVIKSSVEVAYVFDSPHRNIIAKVGRKDIFKVIDVFNKDFIKVIGINIDIEGYVYLPYFETTALLIEHIGLVVIQKTKSNAELERLKNIENAELARLENVKKLELLEQKRRENERKENQEIARNKKEIEDRRKRLTQLYGELTAIKIINHEFWIGMTSIQASESLGYPTKINETVTTNGTSQQWVYENKYLYFENGVLKSYQRSF